MKYNKHVQTWIKKIIFVLMLLFYICSSSVFICASDLTDQFSEKYQSLMPKPNSSVSSDYLFEQISLGSHYTVQMLDSIYGQNRIILDRYDTLLEKHDTLIQQNNEIIELLKKMADGSGN